MSRFVTPKVFAPYEPVFKSLDLNAIVAAVASSLNSINNSQVASGATISGSKLANLSVLGEKFNSGSVGPDAIEVNAFTTDLSIAQTHTLRPLDQTFDAMEHITLGVEGATVLVLGLISGYFTWNVVVLNVAVELRIRRYLVDDGNVMQQAARAEGITTRCPFCMVAARVDRLVGAGIERYYLEAMVDDSRCPAYVQSSQLIAVEVR